MNPNGKGTVISLKRPWQVNLGPSSTKGLFGQTGWDCGYTHTDTVLLGQKHTCMFLYYGHYQTSVLRMNDYIHYYLLLWPILDIYY